MAANTLSILDAAGATKSLNVDIDGNNHLTSIFLLNANQFTYVNNALNNIVSSSANVVIRNGSGIVNTSNPLSVNGVITLSGNVNVNNFPSSQNVVVVGNVTVSNITVSNFPASQNVVVTSNVNVNNFPTVQAVSGTVSVGNFPASQNVVVTGGAANVGNFPATQNVYGVGGTINVGNLPATQTVGGVVNIGNFVETSNVFNSGGTVNVSNFPATQTVGGIVNVGNFPATQTVALSGNVNVNNFPTNQTVTVSGGTSNIGNFPATQPVSGIVNVNNFPATQTVGGQVNVGNLPATQNTNIVSGNLVVSLYAYATPLGYQQLVNPSNSTLTVPGTATYAAIQVEGANVRYRDDGTGPTTTVGMPLLSGQLPVIFSGNLSNVKFTSVSGSSNVNVLFYK